jgi:hypothetical protein
LNPTFPGIIPDSVAGYAIKIAKRGISVAEMSFYPAAEITSICVDFLVELRGFEPLTSARQAAARRTAAPLPVLRGLIAKARRRTGVCFRQRYVSHQSASYSLSS